MSPKDDPEIEIRPPRDRDGRAVHRLIAECPPLDPNSLYCNLLQCTHFADTCAVAEGGRAVVGFLSSYVPPRDPETLFVWQIAVRGEMRGRGIAKRMLFDVLARPACKDVRRLQATVTEANGPSSALFSSIAAELGAAETRRPLFARDTHFADSHDTETLIAIGPFVPIQRTPQTEEV